MQDNNFRGLEISEEVVFETDRIEELYAESNEKGEVLDSIFIGYYF